MTEFKRGDAVVVGKGDHYVVTGTRIGFYAAVKVMDRDGYSCWLIPSALAVVMAPNWIIKWRVENMPPAPTEPLEQPANTEETKTVRILARENAKLVRDLADLKASHTAGRTQIRTLKENAAEMRAEIMNNCHAHEELLEKMQERDKENLNLRISARNDCDNIELLNAAITEFREEKGAHIRRFTEAERELEKLRKDDARKLEITKRDFEEMVKAHASLVTLKKELTNEKGHNENHAEHISKLCEELSSLKRDRDYWMKRNDVNVKACIELRKELAAEKAFNVSSELVARTGASDKIIYWRAVCCTPAEAV